MWGDPERAITLDTSDPLSAILLQICGPAHIPWQDPRWQELLHGYNVWVHLENLQDDDNYNGDSQQHHQRSGVVWQACQSLLQYAPRTSNLAALALHVTRMLREILPRNMNDPSTTGGTAAGGGGGERARNRQHQHQQPKEPVDLGAVELFSNRIAMVGKARAVAGALNLLRILCHAVIVHACTQKPNHSSSYLEQIFLYESRDSTRHADTATDLISAACQFLVSPSLLSSLNQQQQQQAGAAAVPELYDTATLCLELLLVLLSTQVYQPMCSSFQPIQQQQHFFWDRLWAKAREKARGDDNYRNSWTPRSFVLACLSWQMTRPKAPPKSIAHYLAGLAQSVVQAANARGGEKKAADGMYENHLIVMAASPRTIVSSSSEGGKETATTTTTTTTLTAHPSSSQLILDATKGVLVLSTSIIWLPFRLVSLALGLWGPREKGYDKFIKGHLAAQLKTKNKKSTKDALWLSDSVVADFSTSLLLLLVHNRRAGSGDSSNPFRNELASLRDNRWDSLALPDLPEFWASPSMDSAEDEEPLAVPAQKEDNKSNTVCSVNFESLFESFGWISHTELGALSLYTTLQASKSFAEAVAARSDLDALILPMLRTLYFASSSKYFIGPDAPPAASNSSGGGGERRLSVRNCPFRSLSQLYVIIILFLIFSQDAAFGPDAFRRIRISYVPFYKERNLKEISLGSLLILSLLRNLTFNLNRLCDPFLLSNCCAILMNLSNSVVDIHEYTAMRLAAVTISTCKKYTNLNKQNPQAVQEDPTSTTSMYCEVSKTLLRVLRQCLSSRAIEGNLQLVYALVYHCTDLKRVFAMEGSPFRAAETRLVEHVASTGTEIVERSNARAASKALEALADNLELIKEASSSMESSKQKSMSNNTNGGGGGGSAVVDDFTFTYEEEADPEVFFVPYIWEVVVCAVTAGSIGWRKRFIQIFPLLDDESTLEDDYANNHDIPEVVAQGFAKDVSDVV